MDTFAKFALAGSAIAALAGTAYAASKAHTMDVPLPNGSVVHIRYYGDVAPRVTVDPRTLAEAPGAWSPMAMPRIPQMVAIPDIDRMIAQMDRQMAEMARHPISAPGVNVVSYGNMPARANSVSVYTVSNGGHSCTRTTEVVSQGQGKPPKVTTKSAGECGPETAIAPPAAPSAPAAPRAPEGVGPIDHT